MCYTIYNIARKEEKASVFGYVKPVPAELLVREYEFYKATYCGVCRSMKKCTGALSNTLHTYDSVFLALIRMLFIDESTIDARRARCIAHPIKKRTMLVCNEATDYTACAFGILTYYKLCDDISDERLPRRIATGIIRPIFASAKRRAGMEELSLTVRDKLREITQLETERCESVDKPAALFGELLGEIFSFGLSGADRTVTHAVGLHLGKFIYAADAAEDYEKDRRSGSYNPYVQLYGGAELTDGNRSSIKCGLILECRELEAAVNLLPFGKLATIENIVRNIIYLGLTKRIEFLDAPKEKKESKNEQSIQ